MRKWSQYYVTIVSRLPQPAVPGCPNAVAYGRRCHQRLHRVRQHDIGGKTCSQKANYCIIPTKVRHWPTPSTYRPPSFDAGRQLTSRFNTFFFNGSARLVDAFSTVFTNHAPPSTRSWYKTRYFRVRHKHYA